MTTLERIPSGVAAPTPPSPSHGARPRERRPHGRPPLRRPARPVAALLDPGQGAGRGPVRRRHRLRRLEHPRLPAHPRERHAAHAGPDDGLRRPDPGRPDDGHHLRRRRSGQPRAVLARPALHRPQGRAVPRRDRHRHDELLGPGDRVLHLRLDPLRSDRPTRLSTTSTRTRASGTRAATARRTSPTGRGQGGLLPGPAGRQAPGPALADDPRSSRRPASTSRSTTTRWAPPARPRSTCGSTRWSDGRQGHPVQVHRQAERGRGGQGRDVHAQADLRRQRLRACTATRASGTDGHDLFYDAEGYALLSEMARHYIGGLLKHAPAILAFAAPTTNSYRRLVPGYEAPINLVYTQRNRSACVRIPTYFTTARGRAASSSARPTRPAIRTSRSAPADGRPRRRDQQDRAAGADRQGHLRDDCRGEGRDRRHARARSRRCSTRSRRTTSSCSGATSSPRT